jgi:hypothetical protein
MAELNLSNCYNPLLINAFWEKRPVKDLRMEFNRRYFTALGGLMDEIQTSLNTPIPRLAERKFNSLV